MSFLLLFSLLSVAFAQTEDIRIFVALSEVVTVHGDGTSEQLNHLVKHYGSHTGSLRSSLVNQNRFDDPSITVYTEQNIRFLPESASCDYINTPLDCGVKNGHWTLITSVYVGAKYATVTVKLYDEQGREISKGTKTANGKIRWIPQWKLTRIKQSGGLMGDKETEIFEMYPPKMEELPPLITPFHIHQAMLANYMSVRVH